MVRFTGIYKNDGPYNVYVDIGYVPELSKYTVDSDQITLGSGVTLSRTIGILRNASAEHPGFAYAEELAKCVERIASLSIRNVSFVFKSELNPQIYYPEKKQITFFFVIE
jgi:xanthine dehydrogenase/oxidase